MRQILLAGLPPRTGEWLAYRLRGETVEVLFSADDLIERVLDEQAAALVVLSACGPIERAEREVARVRAACGPAVPMIVEVDSGQASVTPGFLGRLTQEHGVRRIVPSTASRGDLLSAVLTYLPQAAPPRPPAAEPRAFPTLPQRRFPERVDAAMPAVPPAPAYRVPPPPPRIELGIDSVFGFDPPAARPALHSADAQDEFGPLVLMDTALAVEPRVVVDPEPVPQPRAQPAPEPSSPRPFVLVVSADDELHDAFARAVGAEYEVRVGRFRELLGMERDDADAPAAVVVDVPAGQEARVWKVLDRVCRRLPGLPVLVATSSDALEDRVNAVRVGAHACIQKPVAPETAREVLARAVPARRPAVPRVLVVDADASVLRSIDELFGRIGWNVHTVARPAAVWDALAITRPDLLILASSVGGMDGVDLCRAVRSDPRWHRLPVLFLTDTTETPWLYRAYAAGADDHVAKPFWGPDLVSRARNRLRRGDIVRV
jgi:DNA-binding response OmpR family regulator